MLLLSVVEQVCACGRGATRGGKHLRLWIAPAALTSVVTAAKPTRRDLPAGWPWDTIPQIAGGASWETTLILVNLNTVQSKYKVDFHSDGGGA